MSASVDRAFVRIDEGLVHFRRIEGRPDTRPLVLVHASPGSSHGLLGLMEALHAASPQRTIIAPDTLGAGDSAPPAADEPDVAYYAGGLLRALDALGLGKVDLYGAHTGARIVCEAAVLAPERVGSVVMDGIAEYPEALREELLAHYAPPKRPDEYGGQFLWAFNFVRDMSLHFPYYRRDPGARLTTRPVPSPEALHASALEVLKGLGSYHKAYNAVFRYPAKARIARLARPALLLETATEIPSLNAATTEMAALAPTARVARVSGDPADKARAIAVFLDGAA